MDSIELVEEAFSRFRELDLDILLEDVLFIGKSNPSTVYAGPNAGMGFPLSCFYSKGKNGGCIIGQGIKEQDFDLPELMDSVNMFGEGEDMSASIDEWCVRSNHPQANTVSARSLAQIQNHQDVGAPWGVCVAEI